MKTVLVIDGQGGRIGAALVEKIRDLGGAELIAVGTNALATNAMIRAGAKQAATGENAVKVCCKEADVVVGPLGIVIADALLGEITPKMAKAVGSCKAKKILIPLNMCNNVVAGVGDVPVARLLASAISEVEAEVL